MGVNAGPPSHDMLASIWIKSDWIKTEKNRPVRRQTRRIRHVGQFDPLCLPRHGREGKAAAVANRNQPACSEKRQLIYVRLPMRTGKAMSFDRGLASRAYRPPWGILFIIVPAT